MRLTLDFDVGCFRMSKSYGTALMFYCCGCLSNKMASLASDVLSFGCMLNRGNLRMPIKSPLHHYHWSF